MLHLSDTLLGDKASDPAMWRPTRVAAFERADADADLCAATGVCNALMISTVIWLAIAAVFL